jgi:hypothetical protein
MMENFRVDMKIIKGSSLCNYLLISISQNGTLYSCDFLILFYVLWSFFFFLLICAGPVGYAINLWLEKP